MKNKLLFTVLLLVALVPNLFAQETYYYRASINDKLHIDSCWFTEPNGGGRSLAGQGFTTDNRTYIIGCAFAETNESWTVSGENSKVILGDLKDYASSSSTLLINNGYPFIGNIDVNKSKGGTNSTLMMYDPILPTINNIEAGSIIVFGASSGTQYIPIKDYYSLTFTGGGKKILMGDIKVTTDFTISGNNIEVDFGSFIISGECKFVGYGTKPVLKTSHSDGIQGNIQTNGEKTFSSSLCYSYYGNVTDQPTGFQTLNITDCDYLEISNPNGVVLDRDLNISSNLQFTNGIMHLGNYNLTLGYNCSTTGIYNSNNMIVCDGTGILKKLFQDKLYGPPLVIPLGDANGKYSPVTFNTVTTNNQTGSFTLSVKNTKDPSNTSTTNYINKYWLITAYDFLAAPQVTMTFQYDASDVVGTENLIIGGMYSNGFWSPLSAVNPSTHSFMAINKSIPLSKSQAIHFTAGEDGVMPVKLNSFTSSILKNDVTLKWQTAFEQNNSGFEVYRKLATATNYSKIGFIKGNGTITTTSSYSFADRNLSSGKYSYQIKQIDNNGNYEYFNLENEVIVGIPEKYELSQNYPNPFNPSTKINFSIPKDSKVSLQIYDMLGKEVKTLVNEYKAAGYYTVDFNAGNLTSGIYFYVIRTDNFTQSKKMILIK